jgi:hypothetical protein
MNSQVKLIYTLVGGVMIVSYLLYSLSTHSTSNGDDKRQFDTTPSTAILILGGGLMSDGTLPNHTQLRLNRAVEVFKALEGKAMIIPLSGGTPHKPNPLDREVSSIDNLSMIC